jgi:hypothetical protein
MELLKGWQRGNSGEAQLGSRVGHRLVVSFFLSSKMPEWYFQLSHDHFLSFPPIHFSPIILPFDAI